jgi:uncharacterized repeat protein (TIGR04138 family)
MSGEGPQQTLQEVAAQTRYPLGAFHFVRRGLDYTVHQAHGDAEALDEADRHVDGQQLCRGLRDFAIEQYGRLARTVLHRWNIYRTEDFGRIVFAMVDAGLMQATESDSVEDFEGGFDFDEAFAVGIPVDRVPLENVYPDPIGHG